MSTEQMLAILRHAYHQLCEGVVGDGKRFADGLIAPVIRSLEVAAAKAEPAEAGCAEPDIVVTDTGQAWNYATNKDVEGTYYREVPKP